MERTDYEKQAQDFLTKTNTTYKVKYLKYGSMGWDNKEDKRHIFQCTIKNAKGKYTTKFGQSIADGSKEPTAYDFLSCLTKNDPECFEFFCGEYGYDTDSRSAYRIYLATQKEYDSLVEMFDFDELEQLNEID